MVDQNRDDKEIDEQQELERALSTLRPAASSIDRDRFLFLAGRASAEDARPGAALTRWMWPAATFSSSLAAVVLLVLLVTRTGPDKNRGERLEARGDPSSVPSAATDVAVESAAPTHVGAAEGLALLSPSVVETAHAPSVVETAHAPSAEETARALAAESNYPRLRSYVLAYGIDALPESAPIRKSESSSQADDEPITVREMLIRTINSRSAG